MAVGGVSRTDSGQVWISEKETLALQNRLIDERTAEHTKNESGLLFVGSLSSSSSPSLPFLSPSAYTSDWSSPEIYDEEFIHC
jgi:hypothetical protein